MSWDQFGIMLTGVVAIWLSQDRRESWRRWACIFGMAGQPFWFYAAIHAEQWGIVFVNCLYTYSWARGVWNNWLRPPVVLHPEQPFDKPTRWNKS